MDDLLKDLGGGTGQEGASAHAGADPLGGLGSLFGGSGLGSILGGALGGGIGATTGGGLGGLLGGGLGAMLPALLPGLLGMLGSSTANGQTGLHSLLDGMHATGSGTAADSWVGTGESQPVTPAQVEQALGPDKLQQLSAQSGLPPAQVSQGLAAILPALVNHLTPNGQVPSAEGVQTAIGGLMGGQAAPATETAS
jgi:uncharacterized protein YidB (DUF937 family)